MSSQLKIVTEGININGEIMGLSIEKSVDGYYRLKDEVCGEYIHNNEWVTEDEAKVIFMQRLFFRYLEDIIKIEMDFPNGYYIDGKYQYNSKTALFNKWYEEILNSNTPDDDIINKVRDISKKYDIAFVDMSIKI